MNAPYPPDAPTISQPSDAGPQAPTGQRPPAEAGVPAGAATRRLPHLNRRLTLLTATLYMPVILICYALYLFGPTSCVAGPFCALGDAPALAQVALLAVAFGLLYLLTVRPLAAALDERLPAHSGLTRTLRQATRFQTIRPLLALLGGLIASLLIVGLVGRTLTLPAFALGAGMAVLFLSLAAADEQ